MNRFDELKSGELFRCADEIYMRLSEPLNGEYQHNAVCICGEIDGELYTLRPDIEVRNNIEMMLREASDEQV